MEYGLLANDFFGPIEECSVPTYCCIGSLGVQVSAKNTFRGKTNPSSYNKKLLFSFLLRAMHACDRTHTCFSQ